MRLSATLRSLALTAAVAVPFAAANPAEAATARVAQAACPAAAVVPGDDLAPVRSATLCLVNLERTQRGLRPLKANGKLEKAATGHSRDMVSRSFFSHDAPGGSTMTTRIKASGYLSGARSATFGENIAWGTGSLGSPLQIVRSWMASPGHRANILSRAYAEIGVGVASGAPGQDGGATYTTNFGARG